jgi:hypothetical protein
MVSKHMAAVIIMRKPVIGFLFCINFILDAKRTNKMSPF